MEKLTWLLLLYGLPARRATARVSLWRKLQKFGAVQLKTSAYVLPDTPTHYERFQWLATQVRDSGGDATLVRVAEIDGMKQENVIQLFTSACDAEYKELMSELQRVIDRAGKGKDGALMEELESFQKWLNGIREVDFFGCPTAQDAQMLLQRAERAILPKKRTAAAPLLNKKKFQGRIWLTRPRPGIDRVGSAWLIQRYIDAKARFVFGMDPKKFPDALPFDMADVEFSHHGDDCTFETLLKRFGITDRAAQKIGEMIHDADLEDEKFHQVECVGLNAVFEGWAKMGLSDDEIINKGGECFEALYHRVRK